MVPLLPPTGSVTVAVARALPRSRVVGAFHHLPAGPWADLDHPLDADVMVCSDDRAATREVVGADRPAARASGASTAGGLSSALAIEALTPALLEINRRYKTHAAVRITGLPDRPGAEESGATVDGSHGPLRHRQQDGWFPSSPARW